MMVTTKQAAAQRVVLRDVSWDTYERLLHDLTDHSAPRLTFDEGTLEIMTPLLEHEGYSRFIDILLLAVEETTGVPIYNAGSTTFARPDLQKGFESDSCYYIQHGAAMRGKTRVDAQRDPPPDLVVEIDMTHSTLAKLTLYARFGVPEVWRYDDGRMEILTLEGDGYRPATQSRVVPLVTAAALTTLVRASAGKSQGEWWRVARAWARKTSD
jgi:Uma2 family endonuclease